MGGLGSLISDFEVIMDKKDKNIQIGQIRCRQDPAGAMKFWQARIAGENEWFGEFETAEQAIEAIGV